MSFAGLAFALFAAAPLATTAAATMAPQDSVVEAELREESEAWIELRLDPLADMVLEAAFATQPPSRFSAPPPLKIENEPGLESLQDGRAALAAARRLHAILPHPLAWGVVFSRLEGCEDAFEWAEKLEALPEITEFFGQEFSIRDEALEFADALSVIEDEFRSALWPARGRRLEAAMKGLQTGLMPKVPAIYQHLNQSLGLGLEAPGTPVYLVWNNMSPGAATYLRGADSDLGLGSAGGAGGICFVGVAAHQGPGMIEETVVHESLHVLDILSAAGRGAFEGLRSRLRAAGVIASDRRLRDVSHGLIFIAAGEAIRRHLDPAHQHYGDTTGLYARLGLSAQCTRQPWVEYLDGDLDREAALDRAIEILLGDAASR